MIGSSTIPMLYRRVCFQTFGTFAWMFNLTTIWIHRIPIFLEIIAFSVVVEDNVHVYSGQNSVETYKSWSFCFGSAKHRCFKQAVVDPLFSAFAHERVYLMPEELARRWLDVWTSTPGSQPEIHLQSYEDHLAWQNFQGVKRRFIGIWYIYIYNLIEYYLHTYLHMYLYIYTCIYLHIHMYIYICVFIVALWI